MLFQLERNTKFSVVVHFIIVQNVHRIASEQYSCNTNTTSGQYGNFERQLNEHKNSTKANATLDVCHQIN